VRALILLQILLCTLSGCRCPKPPAVPPTPPTKMVEITKPCLDPLPELPAVRLPKVPVGATEVVIDAENYRALVQFIMLLSRYVVEMSAKCGKSAP